MATYRFGAGKVMVAKMVDGVVADQRPLNTLDTLDISAFQPDSENKSIKAFHGEAIKFTITIKDIELISLLMVCWRVRLPFWRWN